MIGELLGAQSQPQGEEVGLVGEGRKRERGRQDLEVPMCFYFGLVVWETGCGRGR